MYQESKFCGTAAQTETAQRVCSLSTFCTPGHYGLRTNRQLIITVNGLMGTLSALSSSSTLRLRYRVPWCKPCREGMSEVSQSSGTIAVTAVQSAGAVSVCEVRTLFLKNQFKIRLFFSLNSFFFIIIFFLNFWILIMHFLIRQIIFINNSLSRF